MKPALAAFGAGLGAFALSARILWPGDAAGWSLGFLLDAAALVAAACVIYGEEKPRGSRAALVLAGLGIWALVSTAWAGEALPAWATGTSWVAAGALALAFAQSARGAAVHALVAAAAAQAGYAVWQMWWGFPLIREHLKANPDAVPYKGRELEEFLSRLNTPEPIGTFMTSNVLCAFLAISLPILIGRFLDAKERRPKLLLIGPILAVAFAAVLTKSLGGFVALAAAGAIFVWRAIWPEPSPMRTRVGVTAGGGALFAAIALLAAHPGKFDWTQPRSSMGYRANYARGSMGIIKEAPALGVGASNWGAHYPKHQTPTGGEVQRAHLDALQVWGELGPLGLGLFLAFAVLALRAGMAPQETDDTSPTPWIAAAIGAVAAIAFNEFAESRLIFAGPVAAIAILALFAAAMAGSAAAPLGRFTTVGAMAGLAAFLTHGLVEYDLYVPGVLFAAAAAIGVLRGPISRLPAVAVALPAVILASVAILRAGDHNGAEAAVREAIESPANETLRADALKAVDEPDLALELAMALRSQPKIETAAVLACLDRAIALAPHQPGLRFHKGRFLWERGEKAEALKSFREAVELYPNLAQHRLWLGRARREANDPGWREDFERALFLSANADVPRRKLEAAEEAEVRSALAK